MAATVLLRQPSTKQVPLVSRPKAPALSVVPAVQPAIALVEHVTAVLLHAPCTEKQQTQALEQALLPLGSAIAPALLNVLSEGTLAQQGLAIHLLLRFGQSVRGSVQQFCKQHQASATATGAVAFLSHHFCL
jgi:hypothetical protein